MARIRNVVNVAGEFLRWRGGFVPDLAYVEEHLEKQLANLSPEGACCPSSR
jgi:hypothetical protein